MSLGITDILEREHRVIEKILPVLEAAGVRLEKGLALDADVFPKCLEFLHIFADECHHALEESELFPEMGRAGIDTEAGLIYALKEEHKAMRTLVKKLDELWSRPGDEKPAGEIRAVIRTYARILPAHTEKEDTTCFPLADDLFSTEQQRELTARYGEFQSRKPCQGSFEYYQDLITGLEARLDLHK